MKTVGELYRNTQAAGLSHLDKAQWNVRNFEMDIYSSSVLYRIPVDSLTDSFKTYNVKLLFMPTQFLTEEQAKGCANIKRFTSAGQVYYMVKHTLYSTVQVSCDCENYIYTYAYPNAAVGSHYGPLPQFTVKGTGHPRNPQRIPGMCKHIMNAINGIYGFMTTQLPDY